ncbi:hypothetical protein Hamer_G024991, partial [Homarus americanus]
IQELGLATIYKDSEDVKLFCGMVDSLALFPLEDIPAGIDYLRDHTLDSMEPFFTDFDQTYMTGPGNTSASHPSTVPQKCGTFIKQRPMMNHARTTFVRDGITDTASWLGIISHCWLGTATQLSGIPSSGSKLTMLLYHLKSSKNLVEALKTSVQEPPDKTEDPLPGPPLVASQSKRFCKALAITCVGNLKQ